MDIVVKIKHCLLATFILGNVQLIAMNLRSSDLTFEQYNKEQIKIDKLVAKCKKRYTEEWQKFLVQKTSFERIKQSLENCKKDTNWINLQKSLIIKEKRKQFKAQIIKDHLNYKNQLEIQSRVLIEMHKAVQETRHYLEECQNFTDSLNERKAKRQLQNNDQRGKKREFEIVSLKINDTEPVLKKIKIAQDNSVKIMPKAKVFGGRTLKPYKQQSSGSVYRITKNFSL